MLGGLDEVMSMRFNNVVTITNTNKHEGLFVDERPDGNASLYPNFIAIAHL